MVWNVTIAWFGKAFTRNKPLKTASNIAGLPLMQQATSLAVPALQAGQPWLMIAMCTLTCTLRHNDKCTPNPGLTAVLLQV